MFKKYITLLLMVLVINLSLSASVFAENKADKEAKLAAKVKGGISKLGTGKAARIEVKLKDGTKLTGYISQINDNNFVVVDDKTDSPTEIPYPQTRQIKGHNLSTGMKIVIGIAIGAVVLLALALIGLHYAD